MDVRGLRVRIRPTTHDDLPFLQKLWNDGDVMRHRGYPEGMHITDEGMEHWWAMAPQAQCPIPACSPLTPPHCIIELVENGAVGELSYSVDMHQRGSLDLKLTPVYWGLGIAAEAMRLALRELFACAGVKTIIIEQPAANTRALKLLRRCGFRPAPTENHPDRWECSRLDFACMEAIPKSEVA